MNRHSLSVSLLILGTLVFTAAPACADSLKLKNGQVVEGKYLGGTDSKIDFLVSGRVQNYNVTEVQSLEFDGKSYSASAPSRPAPATPANEPARAPEPLAPPPARTRSAVASGPSETIPAGTTVVVRMIDGIDSNVNKIGDRFNASLESDLSVNGTLIAPRGADVYGRLIEAREAGRIQGQSELRLELTGLKVGSNIVPIVTGAYTATGSSRTKSTAQKAGGGAALGAIIGAIAGGGKGAAIGAGVGAGAGTAVQVMTHGQEVHVPSETVLTFTLQQPAIVILPNSAG